MAFFDHHFNQLPEALCNGRLVELLDAGIKAP